MYYSTIKKTEARMVFEFYNEDAARSFRNSCLRNAFVVSTQHLDKKVYITISDDTRQRSIELDADKWSGTLVSLNGEPVKRGWG